jgi:uncharacterized protein DUF4340
VSAVSVRGTGALVLVLTALLGYLWLFEVRPRAGIHPQPVVDEANAPPLLDAPAASVARVEIEGAEGTLTATRRNGGWTDGLGHSCPPGTVSELIDALHELRPLMVVDPDPAELADYGLHEPSARIRLLAGDGHALLGLEVGERNPASTGIYARVAGRREVLLIGALLQWEIGKVRDAVGAPEP